MSFFACTEVCECFETTEPNKSFFEPRRVIMAVLNVERIDELQPNDKGEVEPFYEAGARCRIETRANVVYVEETIETLFERTCK